jgi:Family of unknown function (DUF5906)
MSSISEVALDVKGKVAEPQSQFDAPDPKDKSYENEDKAIVDLNRRVCYVHDANAVVKLSNYRMMTPSEFMNGSYVNWTYKCTYTPSGIDPKPQVQRRPIADKWFKHKDRLERETMSYVPGKGRFEIPGVLNRWRGFASKPVRGGIAPWNELLNFLFENSPVERAYLERWIAYPIRFPGTKLKTAIVMHSRRGGMGKNILFEAVENIYGVNAIEIKDSDLDGNFNSWQRDRQFVVGDEITGGGENRRKVANRLKLLVTSPTVSVNEKFQKPYTIPNVANFVFLSNEDDPIYIPPDVDDDRRFFVWEVPQDNPLSQEFYTRFKNWKNSPEGIAALHYHLQHLNLGDFKPDAKAPSTRAKKNMSELNRSGVERWVSELKANAESPTLFTFKDLTEMYESDHSGRTVEDNLLLKALGGARLKQANDGDRVRVGGKLVALWIVATDPNSPEAAKLQEKTDAPRVLATLYKAQSEQRRVKGLPWVAADADEEETVRASKECSGTPNTVKVN